MLYALPLIAAMLAGCCTSPAYETGKRLLHEGLQAERDSTVLECRTEQWVVRIGKGRRHANHEEAR